MVSFAAVVCASAITLFPTGRKAASSSSKKIDESENDEEASSQDTQPESSGKNIPGAFRLYRKNDLLRIVASLLANGSILVAGEEGSGKTVLAQSVVEKLLDDGFLVADVQPATSKQMLLNIAEQLGVDTYSLEGKAFTADQLKVRIATFLQDNTAFIIVDECHRCDGRFRYWLKQLQKQGVPMLLLATNPPRTDVFLSIPRIELSPLPQYAIREIMETAALERGINLKNSELAKLQERAGGNPMLAIRAIDEEYLGLEMEAADHGRYFDITPLILLAGIGFAVLRFIGMGTNDHALYIFSGIAAAVFLGFSRLLYNLPQESKRIQR